MIRQICIQKIRKFRFLFALLFNLSVKSIEEERAKYYTEFQEELTKDMPYTFIAYIDAIYVAKSNISGITTDTILGHHGVGVFWNIEDWDI